MANRTLVLTSRLLRPRNRIHSQGFLLLPPARLRELVERYEGVSPGTLVPDLSPLELMALSEELGIPLSAEIGGQRVEYHPAETQ